MQEKAKSRMNFPQKITLNFSTNCFTLDYVYITYIPDFDTQWIA